MEPRLPPDSCEILNVDSGEIKFYVTEEDTATVMTPSTELKKITHAALVLADLSVIASQKRFVVITNQTTEHDKQTF